MIQQDGKTVLEVEVKGSSVLAADMFSNKEWKIKVEEKIGVIRFLNSSNQLLVLFGDLHLPWWRRLFTTDFPIYTGANKNFPIGFIKNHFFNHKIEITLSSDPKKLLDRRLAVTSSILLMGIWFLRTSSSD